MNGENELILNGCPTTISYECTKKITEQMEKNICKIKIGNNRGTGFFCKVPFPDENNMLPVFITNNHVIDDKILKQQNSTIAISSIFFENKIINLNDRIKYTNKEYDCTIIEIKESDKIENYLELDDYIIDDVIYSENNDEKYIGKTLYIIQYPEGHLSVSYGILEKIDDLKNYYFYHKCSTKEGSSGSPILTINNKIIGIHSSGIDNKINKGILLNYPLKDFIEKNIENKMTEKEQSALNAFNEYFKLDIKDNRIEKLHLNYKVKEIDLFQFTKIKFKNLKELYMRSSVSNLTTFENIKFDKLEILDLNFSFFKDLKSFANLKFNNLKKLYLVDNNISDLKGLDTAKIPKLEILDLSINKISDISVLHKMNCKNLKDLNLNDNNNITDLKVFEKVKFDNLEKLHLAGNKIEFIDGLDKANFKNLYVLDLERNNISDAKQFEKITNLKSLRSLFLKGNHIDEEKCKEIEMNLKLYKNVKL